MSLKNVPGARDLIEILIEAIYSEPRASRAMPVRIELGSDLFRQFQREHREALTAAAPEVGDLYPGSLAGVPVVEVRTPGAALVRTDGRRTSVAPLRILPRRLNTVVLRAVRHEDLPSLNPIYIDPTVRRHAAKSTAAPLTRFDLTCLKAQMDLVIVESLDTCEVVGWCALTGVPGAEVPTCEPQIFLARHWQRRGVGRQVLPALTAVARELGFKVQAKVRNENKESQGLLSALGWTAMGFCADWQTWGPTETV